MKVLKKALRKAFISALAAPVLLGAFTLSTALAQESNLVRPQPLTMNGRFMPGFGNETIVTVRYTVKADGTTSDVEVLGGFNSNPFLDNMLKQSVSTWTFTPGTANGQPADFLNQEYIFVGRIDPNAPAMPMMGPGGPGGGRGAPPAPPAEGAAPPPVMDMSSMPEIPLGLSANVKEEIDAITAIVAAQDFDKALKEIGKLERRDLHSVFDYSLIHELKSSILMAKGEPYAALEASMLATKRVPTPQGEGYLMTKEILENALRKQFLLAATIRQSAIAWEAYATLTALMEIPADDEIHAQAQSVKALLDSPEPLGLLAMITEDQWTYKPARRIFTVTDVNGKLNKINARCERRNLELDYQEGVDWTLPASLGECVLDFVGKDGTQFTVYEFAE